MKNLIIPLIFLLFTLSGCYDETEPDNIAYITAIGIDKSENDTYNYTIQFAKTATISGGASEEGGKGGDIVENIVIESSSLYSAINWGNHIISKNLSLAHIKLFVFSEDVAREGVKEITETIIRSQEIRPNIYFAVAKGSAKEYLMNVKPIIEINPAKYYQLLFEQNNYGGTPRSASYGFILYQDTAEKQSVLPLVGVVDEGQSGKSDQQGGGQSGQEGTNQSGGEQPGQSGQQGGGSQGDGGGGGEQLVNNKKQASAPLNESNFEYKSRNYKAGEIGVLVKNKSEAIGMAVFKDDKLAGYMGSTESLIYNILSGNYNTGYLTFKVSGIDVPVTIKAQMEKRPKINYDIKENKVMIEVEIEGDFVSMASDGDTGKAVEEFEAQASDAFKESAMQFLERTRDEFNSDILGVGAKAKMLFLTDEEHKKINWEEKYKSMDFEVKSKIKIRRTGLTAKED